MGLLSDIGSFLGYEDPSEAAQPYLDKIPGEIKQYYDPYIQAGQQALPGLQQQLTGLMQDPTGIMGQIGGQYQASPGYQFAVDQAMRAANQSAAAGGMAGTPANQFNAMNTAQQLANQDYYNYMDRGLSQYGRGLEGTQQLTGMGMQAGGTLAGQLADVAGSQANLAYAGAQGQNQMTGGILGGIGSLLGGIAGGPIGSAIGGGISTMFGGGQPGGGGSFGPALYPQGGGGSATFGGFL